MKMTEVFRLHFDFLFIIATLPLSVLFTIGLIIRDKQLVIIVLSNQSATCRLNFVLQALFHLPTLKRLIYSFPATGNEPPKTNISLNL
jgi:hypothetical protein